MKGKLRVTILVVALMLGVIATSSVAFAGESFKNVNVSTQWTEIASDTEGFDCNVEIVGWLTSVGPRIDVRMLGKNNNVVWEEEDSCPGLSSRVYRCGPDVYKIQVRVDSGVSGSATAYKTNKPVS